ncbi:MAG: c-type cytochrome [Cytophagales bacterium]|nr:c-type cytochrome [Cytophagales bacterium]
MKLLAALIVSTSLITSAAFANVESAKEAAPAAPATPAATKVAKPDLNAGSAKFAAACAACHNADGNSAIPANPKLAGQHPEYILAQLQAFKSGKRPSSMMNGMVAGLTDEDMRNIAYWVAAQKPKAGFAKNADLVKLGEKIYKGGIADRQVPACAGCHSPTGAGIPSQYPRLSGQHADYVATQLTAFRDGTRKNNASMSQVVAKLNDKEIKALADYIAGLR